MGEENFDYNCILQ